MVGGDGGRRRRRARAESADAVRRERVRLLLLREALVDWCEIVGHLLHRPWAPVEVGPPEPPADLLATLPAAVALGAVAGTDEVEHERAVHATLAALCHPGWCAENFDELVAAVGDGGHRSAGGYLAADLDVRGGPFAPRRRLVEACRAGRGGVLATRRALTEVRQAVEQGRLRLADRHVERLGHLAGGMVTESAFFRAAHGPAVPFAPDQWSPRGLQAARHLPETALTWVRPAPRPGRVRAPARPRMPGRLMLRVDLSPRAQPGDLVLFAPARPRASAPAAPSPATTEREFIEW